MFKKRILLKITIALLWVFFVSLIVTTFLTVRWYNVNLQPVDRQQTAKQRFEVVRGSSLDEIADDLQEQGLIKNASAFKWHLKFNELDRNLQAGVFELSPSDYVSEIAETLNSATSANLEVTIYPQQRLDQIEDSLVEQGFKPLDAQTAVRQIEKYREHPIMEFVPSDGDLEGYIFPETFAVNQFNTDSAEDVVRRSLDAFVSNLTDEVKEGILKNFDTIHEGVILASIVEMEVDPQDRAHAAQVFIKRLNEGMKLESDVTFVYAAAVEGGTASVDYPSPYNTRLHPGLPPGPISNVHETSLRAVAFPTDTNDLFFVSGDDGITYFNETLQEHEDDVKLHCIEKCKL